MDSTLGWGRARLSLRDESVEYGSLEEAYKLSALEKEQRIEAAKTIALVHSNLAESKKAKKKVQEKLLDYLKELIPAMKENTQSFIEQGTDVLDDLAGKKITLGGEKDARQ